MSDSGVVMVTILCICLAIATVGGCMIGMPQYKVYEQRLAGEAELEKQKYEKQVAVQGALAKKESAQLLADSEIIRAKGVAQANEIIGASLKGNDNYLRYLWITGLAEGEKQGKEVIYIPTEAGIPILEAGKRGKETKP